MLGLVIVAAGALMNRQSPQPGPSGFVSTETTAPVSLTGTETTQPSDVPTGTPSGVDTATTDPGASATFTAEAYSQAITNLATLLPKTVAGYGVGATERSSTSAIVPLEPTISGPAAGKATIVVLTVFDKKTEAGAKAYVGNFQLAYPKDLAVVTIGTLTGRFGTDGSRLAAVVFSRGRYAFEIVATTRRGAPVDLEPLVVQAAGAFGATKTAP